jgi:hypothetical protein
MGREYTDRYKCTEPGCSEFSFYKFDTRRDLIKHQERVPHNTYKCLRHTNTHEVLSADNPVRTVEYKNHATDHGLFFGIDKPMLGFFSGPGFKVYAAELPAGAVVRVTAELILPDLQKSQS